MAARWKWLRRPKWIGVLVAAICLIGWLLWPVKVYEIVGRTRGYVITLPESSESSGGSIDVLPWHEGPWSTRIQVEESMGDLSQATRVSGLGDWAYWTPERLDKRITPQRVIPPHLTWARSNIEFNLRTSRRLDGHERGAPEYIAACERVARETDAAFLEGKAGSYENRPHWIPRALLWGREQIDIHRRKAGIRTEGWWKDW